VTKGWVCEKTQKDYSYLEGPASPKILGNPGSKGGDGNGRAIFCLDNTSNFEKMGRGKEQQSGGAKKHDSEGTLQTPDHPVQSLEETIPKELPQSDNLSGKETGHRGRRGTS